MNLPVEQDSVLTRYLQGPSYLESALGGLHEADLDRLPADGGWTIRQIVHHIADGDDIWKMCIKVALGNEQAEFTLTWYWALAQKDWADRWAYGCRSLEPSLALLKASRVHVQQLLDQIPDGWSRSVGVRNRKGEVERITVGFIVEMQADHLQHHVNRILAIRKEGGGA